jgi:ATP synthase protein I
MIRGNGIKKFIFYSALGLEMALAVAIGVGIGVYLDKKLDTTPWFLILFLFFGMAAGLRNLYRALKKLQKDINS